MFGEFTPGRYRALELLTDHMREPSRELRLDSIFHDVTDDDLRWVMDRVHHWLLKLLEDAEYDPAEDSDEFSLGLTD